MHYHAITAALLVSSSLVFTATPALSQSVEEEVTAAYAAWDAAFNAADLAAIAAAYTEDALFLPASHAVIKGPAGVSEFFERIFAMGATGHRIELIEAEEERGLIVAVARWTAAGKDAAGADQPWGGSPCMCSSARTTARSSSARARSTEKAAEEEVPASRKGSSPIPALSRPRI